MYAADSIISIYLGPGLFVQIGLIQSNLLNITKFQAYLSKFN